MTAIVGCIATCAERVCAQSAPGRELGSAIRILELQGTAEFSAAGETNWALAQINQELRPLDRLRTGANSRIALRWSDQSILSFGALTELEILPPDSPDTGSGLHLVRGIISFFS